jgi:hypothetical protein
MQMLQSFFDMCAFFVFSPRQTVGFSRFPGSLQRWCHSVCQVSGWQMVASEFGAFSQAWADVFWPDYAF